MCCVSAPPPPSCLVGHSRPATAVTYIYTMGTQGWLRCQLYSHGSLSQSFCTNTRAWWSKREKQKTRALGVFIDKSIVQTALGRPLLFTPERNRHFVSAAALNATDTEACLGLRDHSLLCQQFENKLVKWQIRLSGEMTSRHNKEVAAGAA